MNIAIVAITARGAELARRIGREAGAEQVWLPERLRGDDGCNYFSEPVTALLPRLFAVVDGLVCIMATGIVVRTLATHLRGKEVDPAVVVLDEAGQFAISLLSGHLGGANDLARELAELTGGTAVITTATDVNGLPAWDDVARRLGYGIEPLGHVKTLNSLLLEGRPIHLVDRLGLVAGAFEAVPAVRLCATFTEALQPGAAGAVLVSNRHLPQLASEPNLLALRPRNLVVGIGCNRGTDADEIEAAVRQALQRAYLAFASIGQLASIDAKADEPGLLEFARRHRLPLQFHPAAALNGIVVPSPPSAHALAAVGASGVCEPAALLSAQGGSLLVRKQKLGNVTVAVAEIGEG
ncbi:cobalt-precorrin-5A hydrolase [Desulfuromonas sp. DDH964]|uniref:cobalt-precorrin 5A hydrolase n=1 Tax=Desulfuromonas sp. DDH964 TaxID=1823759 RepID=UPI00078D1D42|nr:cobalt-precorrin 5A hydrolase [Desulfuromonas sp. DDH964]AMV73394.1 cobalt-precorrin-5A hydrolase [Desulfuromonas sp. DDH964]